MSGVEAAPVTPNATNVEDKTPRVFFDSYAARSPRRSISSSRYSGRMSRRSSVRDDIHTRDEFERKQRIVRYMEEERERAERSKLQREEHDTWVEFRAQERAERLQFMTEQEIAELLRREADEALRERSLAEAASRRAAEDALHRRRSIAELRKGLEDAVNATVVRPMTAGMPCAEPDIAINEQQPAQSVNIAANATTQTEVIAAHAEPPAAAAVGAITAAIADTRIADLQATVEQLQKAVAEAKADAIAAHESAEAAQQAMRQAAETAERQHALDAAAAQESTRQMEEQRTELTALHTRLAGSEASKQRLLAAAQEKDAQVAQLTRQLAEQAAAMQRVRSGRVEAEENAKSSSVSQDGSAPVLAELTRAKVEMQKELAEAKRQADTQKRELEELQRRCQELERHSVEQGHKVVAATQENVRLQAELRRARTAAEATRNLHEEQLRNAVAARSARDAKRIAELERIQEETRRNRDDYKSALEQLRQQSRVAAGQVNGKAVPTVAVANDGAAASLRDDSARPATTEALQRTRAELAVCRRQLVDCQRELQQLHERHTRQVDRLRRRLAVRAGQSSSQPNTVASSTASSRRSASFLSDGHTHQTVRSSQSASRVQGPPHMERVREMQQEIRNLRLQLKDSTQREQQAVAEARRVRDTVPQPAEGRTAEQPELVAKITQLQNENDALREQNAMLTEKLAIAPPSVRADLDSVKKEEAPRGIQKTPPSSSTVIEAKNDGEVNKVVAEQRATPDVLANAQQLPASSSVTPTAVMAEDTPEVFIQQVAPNAPLPPQAERAINSSGKADLPAAENGDSAVAAAAFFNNYTAPKTEPRGTSLRDLPAVTDVAPTQLAVETAPVVFAAPRPPLAPTAMPQLDNPGGSVSAPQHAVHVKTRRSCHCC